MSGERRKLKLGIIFAGVGGGGGGSAAELWRHPEVPIDASVNIDWYIRQAREAEEALFDFVFVTDSQYIEPTFTQHHLNRLEPLTLLSAVATHTSRIGLAATVTTSYTEPFDIARRLASLDLISGGRAGWNIVTSYDSGTAGNFSRADHGDHAHRYRRGAEAVAVVQGLWNSYEGDAFASDKDAVNYLDTTRLHRLDHKGEFFSVTGPLNIQRSRQGQPVIIQAGTSEPGRELNARYADLAFSFAKTTEWAIAFAADVRARAATYGRNIDDILFVPALSVRVRDTDEQAHAAELAALERRPLARQLERFQRQYPTIDFSSLELDQPIPDLRTKSAVTAVDEIYATARENGWTLRQLLQSGAYHHAHFIGSPETIADEIEHWYRVGAADGFNLFAGEPEDFAAFRHRVLPLLQQRGLFRTDYESDTFRGNLQLPIPKNTHTLTEQSA
ncbi:NtaA/DmoA family FMN-dependent monooxygenase [Nocardia asteroides]|uniref:NtaA/DmoA family FMN-dependent monooxygenase n=1 Tax=Nocardia asteroides TaxID=1824 RepID=UPI0037957867